MAYTASDLRKGLKIMYDGQPYTITEYQFTKPGKGQAIYTCRLKHLITNNTFVQNFRSNDTFDIPDLEYKKLNFSYAEGDQFVFVDESFEQTYISAAALGDKKYFLSDDMECNITFFEGNPIDIEMATFVERKVVKSDPGVKGNTAAGRVMKPATVDGGYTLDVPLFVEEGDVIRIDTRTGEYADRVMK